MAKGKTTRNLIIIFITIIIVGAAGVFGFQFFTKTGIFHIPGKLVFDENIPAEAQNKISDQLSEIELDQDITVELSRTTKSNSDSESSHSFLYNIYVPVTDFYNPMSSISASEIDNAITEGSISLIPISELTNTIKLLAIDDDYYLNTFNSGAYFEYLQLTGSDKDLKEVSDLIEQILPSFPSQDNVLTFAQTGVTALSRGMNAKLDRVGNAGYFAEKIGNFLSGFDLTHTSNESSFSDYANSENICAKPGMIDALTAIGLDIVELTGNHNQDCGDDDALATLKIYEELGLKTVGGGESADAAAEPLLIEQKGTNITMLAYNLSTGGYTLDNTPGANFYTKEKASADIAAAKARGDFIIVDIQYYECNDYNEVWDNPSCDRADSSAGDQIGFFRELIDMGADIVIGTAAHQPQTYELYGDGVIYYGLGNLFFDQYWWPGTQRSLILVHYFYKGDIIQTRIVPTVYDENLQVELMDSETASWFINRLNQVRPSN